MNDAAPRFQVTVLDMQPIDPPIGGGRLRLLGLYHDLGLPTTYVGTYDWPGERYRHHALSSTLEEIDVPLTPAHFAACAEWQARVGGKTIIDVTFPQLAHHSAEYISTAQRAVAAADIVVFSHPWVYPLVKHTLRQRPQLLVYDSQNVEAVLRAALLDDGGFGTQLVRAVAQVEYELCRMVDLVLACSHDDRETFHRLYGIPCAKIAVVANGTYATKLSPVDDVGRRQSKQKLGLPDQPLAIFIGSAYRPNMEAAEFICTVLASSLPSVTFAICGGVGTSLECAIEERPRNVRIPGALNNEEMHTYLAAADLAVNPMSAGSGTNIKMFDFMAAGLPVISTPIGARGISEGDEPAFVVCPLDGFAEAVHALIYSPERRAALGRAARRRVEEVYSWERISPNLGRLLLRFRQKLETPMPTFSVIIPTYERHQHLPPVLNALLAQTCRDFEVIVVDQSATPWNGAESYADLDFLYIHTNVKGAVKARNTAAFFARGQVLAFTDDDCQPSPDWLLRAYELLTSQPSLAGVEGLVTSAGIDDPAYRPVTNEGFVGIGFMTANLFLRRDIFHAIDGFDERFDNPHFREDTDLGWRALAYGDILFCREAVVFHPPHPRSIARESTAERARFFEKDALLLQKHPERYRELFLIEGHWERTPAFWEHFQRGAEKYGVSIPESLLVYRPHDA